MSTTEAPALLTMAELAARILRRADPDSHATQHAVWRLCRQGMPYVQAAGTRLFREAAVLAWLERRAEATRLLNQQEAAAQQAARAAQAARPSPGPAAPSPRRRPARKPAPAASLAQLATKIRRER
jgi:hypothetical protein